MRQPVLVDLCCGPGGATRGYQLAGFYVVGVDIKPQPHYCGDEFIRADALTFPLGGFDAIHASPPCQFKARVTAWRGSRESHPDLLTPMLARLAEVDVPWVVENVPEALPHADLELCGSQFGLTVKRHRRFVAPWLPFDLLPPHAHHRLRPFMHKDERAYADAMGCTWMSKEEARQAIPPAYTEYIGLRLMDALPLAAWPRPAHGAAPTSR